MAEKVCEETLPRVSEEGLLSSEVIKCSGRYWHMKHEHGIMEDYYPPGM